MQSGPVIQFLQLIHDNIHENFNMAEIGCYDGASTIHYINLLKNNNGHVHIVDWFRGNVGISQGIHPYRETDDVYNKFLYDFDSYLNKNMTIHKGLSYDMIKEIPDNSLDLCFIDADHRYSSVYKDIELCLPKVKKGGILCGHDFDDFDDPRSIISGESYEDKIKNIPDNFLEVDTYSDIHYGVIKAVYDHFGTNVTRMRHPGGILSAVTQGGDVWVYRI